MSVSTPQTVAAEELTPGPAFARPVDEGTLHGVATALRNRGIQLLVSREVPGRAHVVLVGEVLGYQS
jgi:hypothetical protein